MPIHRKILLAGTFIFVILAIFLFPRYVSAKDLGEYGNDPQTAEWFRTLMQPDNPDVSCCGEADAYWCDIIHVRDGHTFCEITDDRPDAPRKRAHVPMGTVIAIPDVKLKWDRGNPTGHSIVFLAIHRSYMANGGSTFGSDGDVGYGVYCFVQGSGT